MQRPPPLLLHPRCWPPLLRPIVPKRRRSRRLGFEPSTLDTILVLWSIPEVTTSTNAQVWDHVTKDDGIHPGYAWCLQCSGQLEDGVLIRPTAKLEQVKTKGKAPARPSSRTTRKATLSERNFHFSSPSSVAPPQSPGTCIVHTRLPRHNPL